MAEYIPHLFVGIGQKGCLFTLRETYHHIEYGNGGAVVRDEIRSYHHFNLSSDPDVALKKAQEVAAESGLILSTTRDKLVDELNKIRRASAEEMELREQARKQQQALWDAERALETERLKEVINAGFFPFGKFCGIAFEKAERGYVMWLMSKREDFEEGTLLRMIADKLVAEYPELAAPEFTDAVVGEVGQRLEMSVEVVRALRFDGDFGPVFFVTMATSENACVLAKGSFFADPGEKFRIKATVKNFGEYKGQVQTIVNRVKVLEELA